jgi:hypothetical protein
VKESMRAEFESAERSRQYRTLVSGLRARSTIVYANGTTLVPAQAPNVVSAAPEKTKEEGQESQLMETTQREAPTEPTQPAAPSDDAIRSTQLLSCIAGSATLYGTSWNSDTQEALQLFKNENLEYIACDESPDECSWVKGYPTWVIKKREYIGRMSIEQLKQAADC